MRIRMAVIVAALATVGASQADAQIHVGPVVAFANDFDLGVGALAIVPLEELSESLELSGSFLYFFPSEGTDMISGVQSDVDYWEVNGNLGIVIPTDNSSFTPYLGTGLNVGRVSGRVAISGVGETSETDTHVGLNLFAGVRFGSESTRPFAEARYQIGGGEQFMVAGGVTIPLGG